jgi:predicted Zn finger-like uncharacterized protein
MLIVCPSCATSYDVEPASLQPDGRQVRCVRCRTVWRAAPTQAELLAAAAAALAPDPPAEVPRGPVARGATPYAEESAGAETEFEAIDRLTDAQPADERSFDVPAEPPEPVAGAWSADLQPMSSEAIEADAPPIAPVDLDDGRPPIDIDTGHQFAEQGERHEDIETVAARRIRRGAKRRPRRWQMSHLHTAILALVIIDSILVGWRNDVVRVLPQTASFYGLMGLSVNLRGLVFDHVATSTEEHEGVPILVVQGDIVNDAATAVGVPRLKLAVRNAAKQEIYSWTAAPPRESLSPGQSVAFRTRLASPPPDSRDVLVRFVTRRDIVADVR